MLTSQRNKFRSTSVKGYGRRRGPAGNRQLSHPDYPFTMKLADGRTLAVSIPGRWTAKDRDGSVLLLPAAVAFLDRLQALVTRTNGSPTPGYITSLRESLGMTQTEFGEAVGVAKMTVSRWERGEVRPGEESVAAIEKMRGAHLAKGVVLPG